MLAALAAIALLLASTSAPGIHPIPALLAMLHVIAASMCIERARRSATFSGDVAAPAGSSRLWLAVASGCLVLLASRVTGLLPALTQLGRDLASEQGWYEDRRPVQALALSVLAFAATVTAPALVRAMQRQRPVLRRALAAVLVLIALLVLRAVSLHHVDHVIGWGAGGVALGQVLEIAAALSIILAASAAAEPPRASAAGSCVV